MIRFFCSANKYLQQTNKQAEREKRENFISKNLYDKKYYRVLFDDSSIVREFSLVSTYCPMNLNHSN